MFKPHHRFLALLIAVLAWHCLDTQAAGSDADREAGLLRRRIFRLAPGMPAVNPGTVPRLDRTPPDADVVTADLLSIEPPQPCHWIFSPGEPVVFRVSGRPVNSSDSAVLTAWDWHNRPVAQTVFSVPFEARVTCAIAGRGTYVLTLDAMRGDQCAARLVRSFSVCPSNVGRRYAWRSSDFWIGQCSFPGWHDLEIRGHTVHPRGMTADESRALEAELVARMGVTVARINLPIARLDDQGMKLDFASTDKCVADYASRGLALDLQLFGPYGAGHGPVLDKYANAPADRVYPLKEAPYRHFVSETIRRYGKQARFIQIGNEPGNPQQYAGTAGEYVDQLRQAVDEARRAAPRIPITNGGYCFDNEDTRKIVSDARGLTDFVSYHWHGDLPGLRDFWSRIQGMHADAGYTATSYANTEMGYAMPTVGGEMTNAIAEMQKLLYCWAHGHRGVLLYSSRELWWPRQYSYDGISDYGFVDHFFCPRYVYGAVSAFVDWYAGFKFHRTLKETDGIYVYEFRAGKRAMIAGFAQKRADVRLKSNAVKATVIDAMGNPFPAADAGLVELILAPYPASVLLEDASNIELLN